MSKTGVRAVPEGFHTITPHLVIRGAEKAIEFYKKALGAKVEVMMRFKDAPAEFKCSPGHEDKIMHSCLRIGETAVMASDGMMKDKTHFEGITLTINTKDEA